MTDKLRVLTVAGTRPELIRLSRLIPLLDQITEHKLAFTGQNFDENLRDVFFRDLEIRDPDYEFNVSTASFGSTMAETIVKTERVLVDFRPHAVVILGDTNSAMAAIPAERMGVPVYHLEAGNRSFDKNVPEELNRTLVDHISTFNLPYSEHGRRNLIREGKSERMIFLSGSPIAEILEHYRDEIEASQVVQSLGLARGEFFLASLHRQENVDDPSRLRLMIEALNQLGSLYGIPVVLSTHPRTKSRLSNLDVSEFDRVTFAEPFSYFDYMQLQFSARCVISDSGTLAEESSIAGFPCVILRDSMERPEALEAGMVVMSGPSADQLKAAIEFSFTKSELSAVPREYEILDFSRRVASVILSTAHLARRWQNTEPRV